MVYDRRINDWSSDGGSSDLSRYCVTGPTVICQRNGAGDAVAASAVAAGGALGAGVAGTADWANALPQQPSNNSSGAKRVMPRPRRCPASASCWRAVRRRQGKIEQLRIGSEEHTSELQSLMRTSYDVFCLKN